MTVGTLQFPYFVFPLGQRIHITVITLALLLCSALVHATHNRAGEIVYCHVSGLKYSASIITHTKTSSPADRNELEIFWGDGTSSILPRVSIDPIPNADAQRNVYVGSHTYLGPGSYTLSFVDENRNGGVLNIPNSLQEPFCVKSELVISPFNGNNCSIRFLNPPLQDACLNQLWVHNSVAYDPDGDSLSYEAVVNQGYLCQNIPGYEYPNQVTGSGTYTIDPITGTIRWSVPQLAGEYNIAFRVTDWRNGQRMGSVVRDMQVTVLACNNQPPVVSTVRDTCVEAGTFLTFSVEATDPNGNSIALDALGSPFQQTSSPAFFSGGPITNPANGTFNWNTNCSHVQLQPHHVVFQATDNATPVSLTNVEEMDITIVAPATLNPSATPDVANMVLNWDPNMCSNASGYKIYRRQGSFGYVPGYCEVGVPAYTGYTSVDNTFGHTSTTFIDNTGLSFGVEYCYMIVACFPDGAQSYASVEFCGMLQRDAPIITHASVGITDITNGVDTIRWVNAVDLDTVQHPGPYFFEVYRGNGQGAANTLIHTTSTFPFLDHPDTSFIDVGLDTRSIGHGYRVELHDPNGLIGSSNKAETPYLTLVPNDEELLLLWTENVPWNNTYHEIFRFDGSQFQLVGTSATNNYLDTGLVNGQEYCYYVKCFGAYGDTTIVSPLINFSQENCGTPIDLTPPCPPRVELDNDCELPLNTLTWNNPNNSCEDKDTWQYNIYFADSLNGNYQLIATITNANDTTFTHTSGLSVAGCYQVTAIDSVGNESAFQDAVCGDNCPLYELPNVFTPNGDGSNDTFRPFPYRGVERIDLNVYNRWGQLVFHTEDPAIGWDGTHQDSGERVTEGVYYYICRVYYILLSGEEMIELKGTVHMLDSNQGTAN